MRNDATRDTAQPFAVEADEDESPFAMVGDWVLLAPISDRAVRVYCILRAHVNHARGDDDVWPSQDKIAAALGLSKADAVSAAIAELVAIRAVRKRMQPGRNGRYTVYTVRLHAPPGFAGLRSAAADLHAPGAVERLRDERVARRPERRRAGDTPSPGVIRTGDPSPGDTPSPGVGDPPALGGKPYEQELDEPTTHTAPARGVVSEPHAADLDVDTNAAAIRRTTARQSRHRRSPAGLNATARSGEAARLVREFAVGRIVTPSMHARWGAAATPLLAAGISAEVVLEAMCACSDAGYSPAALEGFATGIVNRRESGPKPTRREQQMSEMEQYAAAERARESGSPALARGDVVDGEIVSPWEVAP